MLKKKNNTLLGIKKYTKNLEEEKFFLSKTQKVKALMDKSDTSDYIQMKTTSVLEKKI